MAAVLTGMAPPLSSERLLAVQRLARAQRLDAARRNVNAFIEYVMRDERTGKPLVQAPVHKVWHRLAEQHDRLLLWAHVESGKTSQCAIGRVLHALGKNPNLRCAVVSNTHGQAQKLIRSLAQYIEQSSALHDVFPSLLPGNPWTTGMLSVRRPFAGKDPSVQAFGVHSNVLGARIDLLILDDILDYENCRTPAARQDLWDWYQTTLAGRLTSAAHVVCIGNAWHPDDALHRLAKQPGWAAYRYPVLDEQGQSRWPEQWSLERISRKKDELGPVEFARQMLCIARADSEARFKREWLDRCLQRGNGKSLCYGMHSIPGGYKTYTGVDLAVQQHSSADYTVLFTIIVHPDGTREVLGCDRGRWSGPEIVSRIADAHKRYQSLVIVENVAAQDFLVQWASMATAVPIRPFTTGRNKAHPEFGVESIATEMAAGKWIIPNTDGRVPSELEPWMNEMLYYDPAGHTGDCLMASWFSREGFRLGEIKAESGYLNINAR